MKTVISYILKFIQSLSLVVIALTSILLATIFNKNYVLDLLENNNYYQELYEVTKEEISYYLDQSGLEEGVLNNVFNVAIIKQTIDNSLTNLYDNNEITANTDQVKNNLNNNIKNYIQNNNINADEKEVTNLVNELTNIYLKEISYNNLFEKIRQPFNQLHKYTILLLIGMVLLFLINYLINTRIFKERNIIVSLFTCFIILLGLRIFIINNIDISNISFYNESISNILKEFIYSLIDCIKIIAILAFILGLIFTLYSSNLHKELQKRPKFYYLMLVIIWMGVIFSFSQQDSVKSTKASNVVTTTVVAITTSKNLPREKFKEKVKDSTVIIRKTAHFFEFFILGILITKLLNSYHKINKRMLISAIVICFIYALTDEFHQMFISGRSPQFSDCLIDTLGATIGIIGYNIFNTYRKKTKKCREMSTNIY